MKPLAGKRILVTRGEPQARLFADHIEREGGGAIITPLLAFQMNDSKKNDHILSRLHDYSWVFLTSSNGVKFFFELLHKKEVRLPDHIHFAIIGKKTNRELRKHGVTADFMPSAFHAVTMAEEFFGQIDNPGKLLLVRGNRSRDVLPNAFREEQVFFHSLTVYDTLLVKEHKKTIHYYLQQKELDALTFTSPSTVEAYLAVIEGADEKGLTLPCFCIGPTTANKAKECGFKHVYWPQQFTIQHMIEQMVHYFLTEGDR